MVRRTCLVAALLASACAASCERAPEAPEAPEATQPAAVAQDRPRVRGADAVQARNACELLDTQEVGALIGESVRAERENLASADQSICAYSTGAGVSLLYVTAHWTGGREEWRNRPLAGAAHRAVAGIGDAAYFGDLLPSAVLDGDVLLEFAMPLLPDEQASFRILAQKAVARLE